MFGILNLISNTIITGFTIIGIGSIIIKVGNFFKIIEQDCDNNDNFKKSFDKIMLDTIEEINTCIESIGIITNNSNKIFFILFDIFIGNKIIKKDKDGKIIITDQVKFKKKIEELNNKLKKYESVLHKKSKSKSLKKKLKKELLKDLSSDDDNNNNHKNYIDDISSDDISDNESKENNKEFYL
jgi:hypothetical protein